MTSESRKKKRRQQNILPFTSSQILDVGMTAKFLDVSVDTVYTLFKDGELPGRKVGRKWKTTKAAVLRWLENSINSYNDEVATDTAQD